MKNVGQEVLANGGKKKGVQEGDSGKRRTKNMRINANDKKREQM